MEILKKLNINLADTSVRWNITNTSLNVFQTPGVTWQWVLVKVGNVGHLDRNNTLEDALATGL
jgi:hypothetical protein